MAKLQRSLKDNNNALELRKTGHFRGGSREGGGCLGGQDPHLPLLGDPRTP